MSGQGPKEELRVLSFDVGIRHLAYCDVVFPKAGASARVAGAQIREWDIIDLDRVTGVDVCCKKLTDELHRRFEFRPYDVILIERQPRNRSIMMVAIQMFLCSYFNVSRVAGSGRNAIKFMHASLKLACDQGAPSALEPNTLGSGRRYRSQPKTKEERQAASLRYRDNKRRAVSTCTHYLTHVLEDFANAALLEQYPKKDDLADAFLQAVAYVEGVRC